MKSVLNVPVSVFKNAESKTPKSRNLWEWLQDDSEQHTLNLIRTEESKAVRDTIKKSLSCCTISGVFSTRLKENLISHSGLICIDIDAEKNTHLVNQMKELKQLIATAPFAAFTAFSASGRGLFVIIPIAQRDQHIAHFLALETLFAKIGVTVDPVCKDVSRLRFKSFDPDPFVNHNARPFTARIVFDIKQLSKPDIDFQKEIEWVETALDAIEKREIDLTTTYEKWLHIGFAFSSAFGEEGREFYHRVSQYHSEYSSGTTDEQFDRCLRSNKPGITLATFYHECAKAGIQIKALIDFK